MRIGVIGYGSRINMIVELLVELDPTVQLAAITDIEPSKIKKFLSDRKIDAEHTAFYMDADQMLGNERLDGVLIGTRCSLHTRMAKKVFKHNLPLFLEKPVATSLDDLMDLRQSGMSSTSEVVVSFPLRNTPLLQLVKEIVDSGKLGTIEHVQAVNNVSGGVYYHNWYRDEGETGGLFLQKATHDFDYINYLLGSSPVSICAMKSKQIFKGNKPAGLNCKDCDEFHSCPESPYVLTHFHSEKVTGEMCSFATDTGNEDSGSALLMYPSGMHVVYSQNFYSKKTAEKRGARLIGYKGTLEFDWATNEVQVNMHTAPRVESYKVDSGDETHGGGDRVLAYNFLHVMQGKEKSGTPLEAGLQSALICLKAIQSANTGTFQEITWH